MLGRLFRSREIRWARNALEEILARHGELNQFEVVKLARKRIRSEFSAEGIRRGFSATQIATVALKEAAEQQLIYGDGNFVDRGMLTHKGRTIHAAHRKAVDLLVEQGVIDEKRALEEHKAFADELKGMG